MDFGLGLVLSLTDRASGGLNSVIVTLNGLERACSSSSGKVRALGNALSSLTAVGAGLTATITAPINAFMGKITKYGIARASFVENTHLAFTSIMSDAQKASDYMQELMSFAKTTPFTYEGITSVAQSLLNYGIAENQILSETEGKFGGILQALGDWAGATGRGESGLLDIADILGKISAEGKITADRIQQLQTRGLVATKIIGNMYNVAESDAQAFIKTMSSTQFINDLVKGIEEGTNGINGATGKMAGQMENLKKTWTGAKDTFISSLKNAGLQLMGEYVDEFGVTRYKFLETMTSSLNDLSKAIKLIPKILQPIMDFIQSGMSKGSAFILKVANAWNTMSETTQRRLSKLLATLTLTGPTLVVIGKVGGGILKLVSNMNLSLLKLLPTLTRFGVATGVLAFVWKSDFAGIRTNTTAFCEGVKNSFELAQKGINGSVQDMQDILKGLDREDFFDNLTLAIMKVQIVMKALSEGWSDYTLSEDTFLKAKELGILPLIESLFDLKYRMEHFFKGFKKGFKEVSDQLKNFFVGLSKSVKGTSFEGAFDGITSFFEKLSDNDPKAWEDFGEAIGKVTAKALILIPVLYSLHKVIVLLKGAVKVVSFLFGGLSKIFSILSGAASGISSVSSALQGFFSAIGGTTIIGVLSTIVGLVTAAISFVDMLCNGFSWLKEIIMVLGIAVAAVGVVILGVPAAIAAAVAGAIAAVATAVVLIVQHWDEIVQFFSDAWTSITNTLAPVGEFFDNLWNGVVSGFHTIFKPVWDMLVGMWNSLVDTISFCKDRIVEFANHIWETLKNSFDNIMSYIQPMIDDFNNFMSTLKEFAEYIGTKWVEGMQVIIDFFTNLWTTVEPYVTAFATGIWNAIVGVFSSIYNFICPILNVIWETICGVFKSIWDGLVEILEGLWDFLVGIFDGIVDAVIGPIQGMWQFVSNIFQSIMNLIMGKPQEALKNLKGAFMGIVNAITAPFKGLWKIIKGAFEGVYKVLEGVLKALIGIGMNLVSGLMKGIKAAWDGLVSFFSNIINGIINFVKGLFGIHSPSTVFSDIGKFLIEGLKNGIEAVWNIITTLFTNILNGLKNLIVGIFNGICTVVQNIWNGIKTFFSTILNGIHNIFSTIFNGIWSIITSIFNSIKNFIRTVLDTIKSIISSVFNGIKDVVSSIWNGIKTVIITVWDGIKSVVSNAINGVKNTISNVFDGVKNTISNVWNGIKSSISTAWDGIKSIFNNAGQIFQNIVDKIKEPFGKIADWFRDKFTVAWEGVKKVFDKGGEIFEGIKNGVLDGLKNVVNGLIDGINSVISVPFNGINAALEGIRGVNILGAKPFGWISTISVPEIPKLALGGVVTQPTTALIGEQGKEAIIPLEKNTQWLDNVATILNKKINGNTYVTPEYSPIKKSISNVYNNEGATRYYTRNTTEKKEEHNSYDYSVTFGTGAIQFVVQNTSDDEARKFAMQVMEYIKRHQELQKMLRYS